MLKCVSSIANLGLCVCVSGYFLGEVKLFLALLTPEGRLGGQEKGKIISDQCWAELSMCVNRTLRQNTAAVVYSFNKIPWASLVAQMVKNLPAM